MKCSENVNCYCYRITIFQTSFFLETDSAAQKEHRNQTPAPSAAQTSAPSKYHRTRSGGARDERYRSGEKELEIISGIVFTDLIWTVCPENFYCLFCFVCLKHLQVYIDSFTISHLLSSYYVPGVVDPQYSLRIQQQIRCFCAQGHRGARQVQRQCE